ncbi:DEAD/DEAH box helicase [Oceanobacillus alkalisoli]|uniref:DEAD/DEAH box helicase n=1 Tax=Oceanobacillus alkalisoli TaxID=2925113 RepID=UPI001F11B133|nr:DEAD/DEAH box helicase family protein [Oceanobacillus alkalisoli]MCF3941603.1 DEAD/DEAH box helicase family protein [Oceanobacillus alkalisoli]
MKFQDIKANITNNSNLYPAQIDAYRSALSHYTEFSDFKYRESLIVMPTGTGKTGVMSLLPFGIAEGRVLIITPGKIVRKTVFSHFDSVNNPDQTFWVKRNIIYDRFSLPKSYLYKGFNPRIQGEKGLTIKKLEASDVVVTNIHKIVSSNEEVNLINLVERDFFDMIIIDEAHHVAANMWQETLSYFDATKVIKLTATPFRGDKLEISNHDYDPIFEYTLGEAIDDSLVKNIVKQEDIPGELVFFDKDTNKQYTLEEAKEELGNEFVSKSIAMSETCSKQVIERTKDVLSAKRQSYPKHQVLAVTCNDEHAREVCKWYKDLGLSATYVSTRSLNEREIEQRLTDYANGKYDVMVSIQMLGEGYDNPNISIISLFRPFKTLGPYAQSIGRGLRKIHAENIMPIDNYCNVIYHQELGLESLWEYYKNQEEYGKLIKKQAAFLSEQLTFDFSELGYVEKESSKKSNSEEKEYDLANVSVNNTLNVSGYSSEGLGRSDSFTSTGYQEYKQHLSEITSKQENKLNDYKEKLDTQVENGVLNKEEADILLSAFEKDVQQNINESYSEFEDLIVSESLREDFTRWLNTRIEEFFKISELKKQGFDLNRDSSLVDNEPIDNIGYIARNIRQSLFDQTGKNVSLYSNIDYAVAKERVIEKLKYWTEEYGKKEDEL